MAKSNAATRKSRTHFEQVPIEVVKKLAEQDAPKPRKAGTTRVVRQPRREKKAESEQSARTRSIDKR
jgi:hypothetical protein